MDTVNQYASNASSGVDKAANKLHNGIRNAKVMANDAGVDIADKADALVVDAKGRVQEGIRGVRNAVQQTRETVSASSESVLAYTRANPVKALAIAAVAGAALWTLAKALASSRD